jgi:hypothetical protein
MTFVQLVNVTPVHSSHDCFMLRLVPGHNGVENVEGWHCKLTVVGIWV